MKQELSDNLQQIFLRASIRLLDDYTLSALMINSCYVAIERYSNPKYKVHLSTTANIPENLRLDPEVEIKLENQELIDKYSTNVMLKVYEQYVLTSVSIIDANFEDVYELLLREYEIGITDKQMSDKIRNAWTNDNLITYFIDKTNLEDITNPQRQLKAAFDRYKEYRIIRHALLHNKGILSDKHIRQLDEIFDETDEDSKFKCMKNLPFYTDRKVELTRDRFLSIRKFLYQFLDYYVLAFE